MRAWSRSFLARYVPSGALTVAVRVRARGDLSASSAQVLSATAFEQLAGALGGAAAATLAFLFARTQPPLAALVTLLGALTLAVALRPAVFARWAQRLPLARRLPPLELVRGRILAAAALVAAASWAITGTAAWILIAALTPSPPDPFFLIGVYAFAWLVGFLVVFAPSGLGVREATLIVLLAPHLGAGPAAVLAVVLRFANIVGDVVAAGAVEAVASKRVGHRPPRANTFEHPARID